MKERLKSLAALVLMVLMFFAGIGGVYLVLRIPGQAMRDLEQMKRDIAATTKSLERSRAHVKEIQALQLHTIEMLDEAGVATAPTAPEPVVQDEIHWNWKSKADAAFMHVGPALPPGHAPVVGRRGHDFEWVLIAIDTDSALQGVEVVFTDPKGALLQETVTSDAAGRVSVPEAYRSLLDYKGQGSVWDVADRQVRMVLSSPNPNYTQDGYEVGTDGVSRKVFYVK